MLPRLTLQIRFDPESEEWVLNAVDTGDSTNVFAGRYTVLKFGLERLSAWLRRTIKEQTDAH